MMLIPTEAIGSIPRSPELMQAQRQFDEGKIDSVAMEALYEEAIEETIHAFAATGSPILSDGEQRKSHSFVTYSVEGGRISPPMVSKFPFKMGTFDVYRVLRRARFVLYSTHTKRSMLLNVSPIFRLNSLLSLFPL